MWNRWKHTLLTPLSASLYELFPNSSAIAFASPSVTLAFMSDFVLPTSKGDAPTIRAAERMGEYSGSICLVRHMMRRAAVPVMRAVLSALAPTAVTDGAHGEGVGGALLVGVHVRRGDRAIFVECKTCVNNEDPNRASPISPAFSHLLTSFMVVNLATQVRQQRGPRRERTRKGRPGGPHRPRRAGT